MAKETNQVADKQATDAKKKPEAPKAKPEAAKAGSEKKAEKTAPKAVNPLRNRLKKRFTAEIVPELKKELNIANINAVPRLEKIVLNMGLGDVKDNPKSLQLAVQELTAICGQKPVVTNAKKSVANFKVREGMAVGAKVTLRGNRMYEFLDKLVSIALPRVRDFRGVPSDSFDGRGNYAMGVKEQLIFPEIQYDQIEKIRGFDVCIVTTAKTDADAKALLAKLGVPFKA